MDLWDFDLTPQEYMAAHFLERTGGRVSGREVAERLGVSPATGRRILASLAEKGLIQRLGNARYALLWVSEKRPPVSELRSPMSVSNLVSSSTTTKAVLVDVPSGTSTSAARPSEGTYIEKRLRMADDLEPGRLKPPAPKKPKRTLFKMPDKYHRFTQPREEWGIPHLVKEFGIRYQHAFPESIYVVEGKSLSSTLAMAQRDHGLSINQLLTAIEQFFEHHTDRVPDNASPTRYFLAYLKRYIRQQPDFGNASHKGDGFDD